MVETGQGGKLLAVANSCFWFFLLKNSIVAYLLYLILDVLANVRKVDGQTLNLSWQTL